MYHLRQGSADSIFYLLVSRFVCVAARQYLKERGSNHLIIVADDDTHYPPRLVETFLKWHAEIPNAALSFRGWVVHKEVVYLKFSESYIVFGNEVRPIPNNVSLMQRIRL
jgi:hypothetical protein